MTATELTELEMLVGRILPDPRAFAERVMDQLLDRLSARGPSEDGRVVVGVDAAAHQVLKDQNLLLAAALGACDCWGHDPGCPVCSGLGGPGWTHPDRELFTEYVSPAVHRLAARHTPPSTEHTDPTSERPMP